jgi:hypothetical protein
MKFAFIRSKYSLFHDKITQENFIKIKKKIENQELNRIARKLDIQVAIDAGNIKKQFNFADCRDLYYLKYLANNGFFKRDCLDKCLHCEQPTTNPRTHIANECPKLDLIRENFRIKIELPNIDLDDLIIHNHLISDKDLFNRYPNLRITRRKLTDEIKSFIRQIYRREWECSFSD